MLGIDTNVLVRFLVRDDELRVALGRPAEQGYSFFTGLVDEGIAAGELDPSQRELVMAFIRIIVVGLTDGESGNIVRHRVAVDAVRAAIEGRLFPASQPLRKRA